MRSFKTAGGSLRSDKNEEDTKDKPARRLTDAEWKMKARKGGFGGKSAKGDKGGKGRKSDKSDRSDRFGEKGKFSKSGKPGKFAAEEKFTAPDSENPFASRRNVHALKSIQGKRPSLPSGEKALRHRRRKDTED